jgi:hypothetical protein
MVKISTLRNRSLPIASVEMKNFFKEAVQQLGPR